MSLLHGYAAAVAALLVMGALLWRSAPGPADRDPVWASPDAEWADPAAAYTAAYRRHAADLRRVRALSSEYCACLAPLLKQSGLPHLAPCLTGAAESELLYLRVRAHRPRRVLEVSPALGHSTLYILAALDAAGALDGAEVVGLDVFNTTAFLHPCLPPDLRSRYLARFRLHLGDLASTAPAALVQPPDYLHVDTCHDEPCIRTYLSKIVLPAARMLAPGRAALASMHDLLEPADPEPPRERRPSAEGALVFETLARCGGCARYLHSAADVWERVKGARGEALKGLAEGPGYVQSAFFVLVRPDGEVVVTEQGEAAG
ncbi:hypothetical protein DFJ74DRAFT_704836 [Hyaloraphidium curvatum]|nr:hypothetical protein DFJ74DRAFT_704836 [Hyaloraphidium curvatum]